MTLPSINFGGLASGLDTNGMIEALVQVERIPIQQLEFRKAGIEAKDSAWTSVLTRFSALRTQVDDLKGPNSFGSFLAATSSDDSVAATIGAGGAEGSTTFTVTQLARSHQVLMDGTYGASDDLVGAGTFTITIDGTDHTVTTDAEDTISDLASSITGLGAGVGASVIAVDGSTHRLMLTSQDTGIDSTFTASGDQTGLDTGTIIQDGADAEIELGSGANAVTVSRSSNVFSDLIPGVTITVSAVTDDPVTVTAVRDTEAAATAIQTFVDELNNSINQLNALTAYNADAETGGALLGDTTARGLTLGLRSTVSQAFSDLPGEFTFSGSIGISLTRDGTFEFDSGTLKDALADNYDDVVAFFEGTDTVDGLADALDSFLDDAEGINGSIARAQDRWQAEVDVIDEQIARLEDRVTRREAQLIREFTNMETAMGQLSGLASSLAAALPGLST